VFYDFLLVPAILDIRQTMMSPAVDQGHVHAASFVTPFWLWNDVSICHNGEVMSTLVLPPC